MLQIEQQKNRLFFVAVGQRKEKTIRTRDVEINWFKHPEDCHYNHHIAAKIRLEIRQQIRS